MAAVKEIKKGIGSHYAETLKTPRIQFFPKLEMRNQAKNVQHVVIRESEAGSAKPSPNPGDLPEAPDSAL